MAIRPFILSPLGKPIAASVQWADTEVTVADIILPPVFLVQPSITTDGTPMESEVVTINSGTVFGGTVAGADIELLRGATVIATNPGANYTLVSADIGANLSLRVTARGPGGETVATSASVGPVAALPPFTSIAANGWQATDATPTDLSLALFSIVRSGFNASASATTLTETAFLTKRVRQAYPNELSLTADQVAVSEFICAADTVAGATNNSTLVSPKPIAAWAMPHRLMITNNLVKWSIAAFHWAARNGKQVACVRVRANNGTTATAWQTVDSTTLCNDFEGPRQVALYKGTIDVTALASGGFWLEAEVYPHVGTSASVLRSEDLQTAGRTRRAFTRRYFRKGSIPAYVVVSPSGNDTTGAASAVSEAAAASTPCLTVQGAIKKMHDLLGTASNGTLDGAEVCIAGSVSLGATVFTGSYKQDIAGIRIRRADGTTRAAAIVTTAATWRPDFDSATYMNEGAVVFEDMTFVLGGAHLLQGETSFRLNVQFINCSVNFGGFVTTLRSSSDISYFGCSIIGMPASNSNPLTQNSGGQIRIMRGVTVNADARNIEAWVTIGCNITNFANGVISDHGEDGHIWYGNYYISPTGTNSPLAFRPGVAFSGVDVGSAAMVQNLIEWTVTTANAAIMVAADSDFGNLTHAVIHHNTVAGLANIARMNIAYDEHPTVARFHRFVSVKGNNLPQFNIKGDVFEADGTRLGHFATCNGVSCAGNFTRDEAAGPLISFAQDYAGIGSLIDGGDPLFTDYEAVTAGPVAGAGGGTYTLQSGSPARDLFSQYLLAFDFAGTARPVSGTVDAGAYA